NACSFAAGSVVWPGAAGARVKKAKRQAMEVRNVKGFFMAALCLSTRDSPMGPKSYKGARSDQSITFCGLRRRHAAHQTAITAWRTTAGHNATPCSPKAMPAKARTATVATL